MAATTIPRISLPHDAVGYNLTDSADFNVLTTGAGNGVKVPFAADSIYVLKNDTGGNAVFTFKVAVPASLSGYGAAVTNPTKTVATGKTFLFRLNQSPFNDSTGYVTIECDVAGKVLVLAP